MPQTNTPQGFGNLNLPDRIQQTLNRLQFHTPTPIQAQAIPVGIEGEDLIGIAKTGTGKTLAFGIPIAVRLKPGATALVLVPTRELAIQVQETLQQLGLRSACIIGGAPMHKQVRDLRAGPAVIVATPGRLIDHLNQRTTNLNRVSIVVLDEADRMFDMGFAPAVRNILEQVPQGRQTMMFSATMPKEICELANEELKNPVRVEIEPAGTITDKVSQEVWTVPFEQKHSTMEHILYEHKGSTLVFTRTRHGARKLAKSIRDLGFSADEIHSDRTLNQRRDAMYKFKTGAIRILVATDIAARGIDVKEIGLVLNFDVPENPEDYIHRIGRTGRAGSSGRAITLATPQQHRDIKDIERLLNAPLPRFNASGIAEKARIEERANRAPNRAPQRAPREDYRPAAQAAKPFPNSRPQQPQRAEQPEYRQDFREQQAPRNEQRQAFQPSRPAGTNHRTEKPRWKQDSAPNTNRPPRSTSNAKRSGKPTWKRGPESGPTDFGSGQRFDKPYSGPNRSNSNDRTFQPGRPKPPRHVPRKGAADFNSAQKPGGYKSDSNAAPQSRTDDGQGRRESTWKQDRKLTPKAFRKPKKAKSYVTRQLVSKPAKPKGPSRFERQIESTKPYGSK